MDKVLAIEILEEFGYVVEVQYGALVIEFQSYKPKYTGRTTFAIRGPVTYRAQTQNRKTGFMKSSWFAVFPKVVPGEYQISAYADRPDSGLQVGMISVFPGEVSSYVYRSY